jgi:hypothetical protein
VAASAGLFVRGVLGLSRYRAGRRPAIIGVQEILAGLLFVAAIAVGFRAGLAE